MIKKLFLLLTCALLLSLTACNEDIFGTQGKLPEGAEVELDLRFGSYDNFDVEVSTRATQTEEQENRVYNIYLMIFDSQGKRIYGHLFDLDNLDATNQDNYWTHDNDQYNSGRLHINTIKKTECTIFAVTNINPTADMMNLSPERLRLVQDMHELENMVATLNQLHTARTGRFVMSGQMAGVNTESLSGTLLLTRMDAKIIFNVQVNQSTKTFPDGSQLQIVDFEPDKWQVYNLPQNAYLFEKNSDYPQRSFFNSDAVNFESRTATGAGFSFYSLENRYTVNNDALSSQALREKQVKDAQGLNGDWLYAPATSTWVYFNGRLKINQTDANGIAQIVDADVRYKVHLGDFTGQGFGDFNLIRNTAYTYNITINGVEDIRTEVEVSGNPENAPGATGDIRVVSEEVYDCDAHYSSYVFNFGSNNEESDQITWYVKTPFSEGEPKNGDPGGLDYEWVHFRLNEKVDGVYSETRVKYDPTAEDFMTVIDLVELLNTERKKLLNGEEHIFDNNLNLKVTAFVDEFYYEKHPLSGEYVPDLWKQFVDQPRRVMHILSDIKRSPDKESSTIATAISIQQRSIQTIYNVHDDNLHSAWGCETIDEYPSQWAYTASSYSNPINENRGNSDAYNGRLNTCKEWGLVAPNGTVFNAFPTGDPRNDWETYLDFQTNNNTPELRNNYRALRYSCMTRNRDNNNNGQIDPDEVRWYMASIRQLVGIWMGSDAINGAAVLYQKTGNESGFNWRQHIVSSTNYGGNSNNPTVLWAEEGSSTGSFTESVRWTDPSDSNNDYWPIYSIRCVRNLGADTDNNRDISYAALDYTPTDYVEVEPGGSAENGYVISMKHLHEGALRVPTAVELDSHNEKAMENRLFEKFEVAPTTIAINTAAGDVDGNGTSNTNRDVNRYLDVPTNANKFCPAGYRLPNQREITIMLHYTSGICTDTHFSRTYFSMGANGENQKNSERNKYGWGHQGGNIFLAEIGNHTSTIQRCVRDVE